MRATVLRRRLIDSGIMFLVAGLSLALLIYVAYGEALRTYQQFHIEKVVAQGAVVQSPLERHLRLGFPLQQYAGFGVVAGGLVASDPGIASIIVFNSRGEVLFRSGDQAVTVLPESARTDVGATNEYEVRQSDEILQVILPLRSRFTQMGGLAVTVPRRIITESINERFRVLPIPAVVLSLAFASFVCFALPRLKSWQGAWLQGAFALTFLVMSGVVITVMVILYAEGAQAKTRGLAHSLGQRLSDIVAFNVNIKDIQGLDRTLAEYRFLNPEISDAALTVNGVVQIHTNRNMVGSCWTGRPEDYTYLVDLSPPKSDNRIEVAVAVPVKIVVGKIMRCVKNFVALFVAAAFVASVFLQLAQSMHRDGKKGAGPTLAAGVLQSDLALSLAKPVFFGAIFVEHLNYAFLPQLVKSIVATSGLSSALVSAPFVAYWLAFALVLIPAGFLAERFNPRPLIYSGLVLAGLGLILLALDPNLWTLTIARMLSGVGQGVLFIGVQSYILMVAPAGKKTQGASLIVLGYQGGMISGMAIGSLLVGSLGPDNVFLLGGAVALVLAGYAFTSLPVHHWRPEARAGFEMSWGRFAKSLVRAVCDFDFLSTMMFIGVPAKAVLTGVIAFALPLLLTERGFAQEDIGQIVMLYAAAVIISSGMVARLVDRTGRTTNVLFLGAAVSGIGLIILGAFGLDGFGFHATDPSAGVLLAMPPPFASGLSTSMQAELPSASVVSLIVGIVILGLAHGFVNAPVVTHVADSPLAARVGQSSATAAYRFLERVGHIMGPIVVGQFLYFSGQNPLTLAWIGWGIIAFGILFVTVSVSQRLPFTSGARS